MGVIHAESDPLLVATYSQRQGLQSRDTSEPNGASKLLEQSWEEGALLLDLSHCIPISAIQFSRVIRIDTRFRGIE
jgi:hypothetical protein